MQQKILILSLTAFILQGSESVIDETYIFPQNKVNRILPLSSYKSDTKHKKVLFSRHAVKTLKTQNFTYTERPKFYWADSTKNLTQKFVVTPETLKKQNLLNLQELGQLHPTEINQLLNRKNTSPNKTIEQGKYELAADLQDTYFDQLFDGPKFNFEVKISSLNTKSIESLASKDNSDVFLGLYTRELISEGQFIGNYVGNTFLGALDESSYLQTKSEKFHPTKYQKLISRLDPNRDYIFNGRRDIFDAKYSGNFLRFVNHQKVANVEALSVYVPKVNLLQRKLISPKIFNQLPNFIETVEFRSIQKILPAEEIFIDYGEKYWQSRQHYTQPLRQNNIDVLCGELDMLQEELETEKQIGERSKSFLFLLFKILVFS